jgi:sugar phosphate isomerase/epimerase
MKPRLSALLLLTMAALSFDRRSAAAPKPGEFGVQLYSVRRELKQDLPGTLAKLKSIGFDLVEVAGTDGVSADDLRKALDAAGQRALAIHAPYERLRDDLASVVKDAKALGATWVVCPWIPHAEPSYTAQNNADAIALFNKVGAELKRAGLRFAYHAHGYEFLTKSPDGKGGNLFDEMLAKTKPGVVDFEMDVFWFAFGGVDPVAYLKRHPRRFPLFHLKDMKKGTEVGRYPKLAPHDADVVVGTGQIDIAGIVKEARRQHAAGLFLEDETKVAMTQLPDSLRYLRELPK